MIDSDSDLISLDSAESLFSVPTDDEDRNLSIRQRVMFKLVEEDDFRDENCALRLMNKDLEQGVITVQRQNSSSEESSSLEDDTSSNEDENTDELTPNRVIGSPSHEAESKELSKMQSSLIISKEYSQERRRSLDNDEARRLDSSLAPLKSLKSLKSLGKRPAII